MSATLTTFLFELGNFLLLAAALGWLFFKPIRQSIGDRRKQLDEESRLAKEKLAEAERTRQEADRGRAHLQVELNELRSRELESARQQAQELLAQAHGAADRQLQLAHQQAVEISEMQRDTLSRAAAAAAATTVKHLLEALDGENLQTALVRVACEQLQALPPGPLTPLKVESASPLSAEELATLEKACGAAATKANYQIATELVSGVRIATANGLIDASVLGLANYARQSLTDEIMRGANHPSLPGPNGDA